MLASKTIAQSVRSLDIEFGQVSGLSRSLSPSAVDDSGQLCRRPLPLVLSELPVQEIREQLAVRGKLGDE